MLTPLLSPTPGAAAGLESVIVSHIVLLCFWLLDPYGHVAVVCPLTRGDLIIEDFRANGESIPIDAIEQVSDGPLLAANLPFSFRVDCRFLSS